MSLTIEHLTKSYGANIAVNDISFRIDSGEVVGFLGPNGAGKSTTMKIITGCISADSGTVLINGTDIATGGTALKHAIGYLPENNPLYLNMYVREYLEYSAAMYMPRSETLSAVNYAVDAVGLGEHQYKKIGELSTRANKEGRENLLVEDLVDAGDLVVLVTPIDESAPKGRLILPQQMVLRSVLDRNAIPVVTKENTYAETLKSLARPPRIVITDSPSTPAVITIATTTITTTDFRCGCSR